MLFFQCSRILTLTGCPRWLGDEETSRNVQCRPEWSPTRTSVDDAPTAPSNRTCSVETGDVTRPLTVEKTLYEILMLAEQEQLRVSMDHLSKLNAQIHGLLESILLEEKSERN